MQAKLKPSTSCSKLDAGAAKKSPLTKKSVASVPAVPSKCQVPGSDSGGKFKSAKPGKQAPKNRLGLPRGTGVKTAVASASSAAANGDCGDEDLSPVYDSVEWSFREKLKKAERKHKVSTELLASRKSQLSRIVPWKELN